LSAADWGALRISDADRDQISAVLDRHAAEGRLTMDELDQRLGTLYDARTRAQAAAVVADLPPLVAAEPSHHFHLGRERDLEPPPLPSWLASVGVADSPSPEPSRSRSPADQGTRAAVAVGAGKTVWAGDLENEIGHAFQAKRRAINAELEQARASGQADEVNRLNELLRDTKDMAASARQAASAGDRSTAKQLIARLRAGP
jgi:hypothetical protein